MVDNAFFLHETEAMLTRLYNTAYSILRSRVDAEDAVQQGLLKAWSARNHARADTFRAWLARIVVNECRNVQRFRMRVIPFETVHPPETPFSPPNLDLSDAIAQLPEMIRIPFILKYLVCLSEQEVAFALRLPKTTVKNRLSKARKILRDTLADWEVIFE